MFSNLAIVLSCANLRTSFQYKLKTKILKKENKNVTFKEVRRSTNLQIDMT